MRPMESIKHIRTRLGLNQKELAALIGKPQSSVSAYERPKEDEKHVDMPPDAAAVLVEHARGSGLAIGFDHIYGRAELPRPRGWIRALTASGTTGDEFVPGAERPDGDGWQALYGADQ